MKFCKKKRKNSFASFDKSPKIHHVQRSASRQRQRFPGRCRDGALSADTSADSPLHRSIHPDSHAGHRVHDSVGNDERQSRDRTDRRFEPSSGLQTRAEKAQRHADADRNPPGCISGPAVGPAGRDRREISEIERSPRLI